MTVVVCIPSHHTHPPPWLQVMMQVDPSLSAMGAVRSTIAAQGPLGLYKGMLAPLATVAAFNAVLFSSRGAAERVLSPDGVPTWGWGVSVAYADQHAVRCLALPTASYFTRS